MAIEKIQLNLIPTGEMPVCHAKQYDKGREIGIDLFYGFKSYYLSDEKLELDVRKSDNHLVTIDVPYTTGTSSIVFATTEQMCAVSGSNICALKVTKGGVVIGSLNFVMEVEKSVLEGGLPSESDIENLETQMTAIIDPMLDDKVPPLVEELVPQVVGDNYYNKTEINTIVDGIDTALEGIGHDIDGINDDIDNLETELESKANANEVSEALELKADKETTYTKEEVDDIVYNILPDDTASGSVATFETDLALPIKSLEVDVNAVQESGTPTPETPLPISGWSEIKAVHTGKNLFDINRAQGTPIPSTLLESPRIMETNKWYKGIRADNYYYENYANCTIENNVLTVYTFNNVNYGVGFPISCKPNTTYILSAEQTGCNFSVGCYDKNWNFISRLLGVTTYVNPLSFTTPSNATYITIVIGSVVNGEGIARNIQLEIGSTSTDYEPYNGNEYIINLGGTCYGGHYTQDKDGHRQFEVTHGFIQYNGLSGQAWRRASNGVFYIDGFSGDVIPYKSSYYKCLSTRVSSTNGALGYPKYIVSQLISNNTRFMVYDADISSDTEFNSNLENKPLELVYELATPSGYMVAPLTEPIIIDLPDGEPIITLNGTNNIYADTGDTSVVFKDSVNGYVEKKIASVQALVLNT